MAEEEDAPAGGKKGGSLKMIIIAAVAAVALIGAAVGTTVFLLGGKEDAAAEKSAKKKKKKAEGEEEAEGEGKGEEAKEGEAKEGEGEEGEPKGKTAVYLDFDQPFTVNFMDEQQVRYLQVAVSVVADSPEEIAEVKRHMPIMRNALLLHFGNQTRASITTREGKEKIRTEALAEVRKIMKEQAGKEIIRDLYFTSFVMQ